jgi:IMP cyclohydrolase
MKRDLCGYLAGNDYPGRGIVLGMAPGGERAVAMYWIMGRSANSRNRVFERIPGGIRTAAADPAKLEDPHLVIYNAVQTFNHTTIVTNGDQTDTIYDYLCRDPFPGYAFESALATRTFEDDAPNYTPRISGALDMRAGGFKLSIIKTCTGDPAVTLRQTFDYSAGVAGEGRFLSTYAGNGEPLPSWEGEPMRVDIWSDDASELAAGVWEALDEQNRIALFVRTVDLATGMHEDVVVNKYEAAGTTHA